MDWPLKLTDLVDPSRVWAPPEKHRSDMVSETQAQLSTPDSSDSGLGLSCPGPPVPPCKKQIITPALEEDHREETQGWVSDDYLALTGMG